ncbi:MAG: hypothetical protein D6701_10780 [Gemmatimonadetes bacterium]|nr:MAG: hypothetical protein D6701_10780 [Gemmatimonadota bacterium]
MNALGRYAGAGLLLLIGVTGALWAFLDPESRRAVVTGAAIAYPVQLAAFAALLRARDEPTRFLVWWGAGILVRLGVVVAVGVTVTLNDLARPAALLLSVAGFFFALLLLEPAFLKAGGETTRTTR